MSTIRIEDADAIVEAIVNEADWTVENVQTCPGGIVLVLDLEQAERDEDCVFNLEYKAEHVLLSEEDGSTSYAMLAEMVDDDGRIVIFVGYHNMGEYCDDETDTSLNGKLHVVDASGREQAMAVARAHFQRMVGDEVVKKITEAVELLEHAGPDLAATLRGNADMIKLMRLMATA